MIKVAAPNMACQVDRLGDPGPRRRGRLRGLRPRACLRERAHAAPRRRPRRGAPQPDRPPRARQARLMGVEAELAQPFGDLTALVARHARERPAHPAVVHGGRALTFGELDARIDRIAATLQRAGVAPCAAIAICAGDCIEYVALFLGALRAGVAVAPIAPSLTPAAIASHGGGFRCTLPVRRRGRRRCTRHARDAAAHPARRRGGPRALARPRRCAPRAGGDRARVAVQHHLFLGHHGRAQGHRAAPRDALAARAARGAVRLRPRRDHAHLHAALLEHDAGRSTPDRRAGRHAGADGQVRSRGLPRTRRAPPRHPRDAGAGAVPAHHGAPRFRPLRPHLVPREVLHQRTVRGRDEARRAGALAGSPGRVLRHDRGRRHVRAARAPAPGEAAHRRPARRRTTRSA